MVYLIDYENVYIDGLDGLEQLTSADEVIIFYTQNRCGLTFDLHRRLISARAKMTLMEVEAQSSRKNTVKNALDLQLGLYIGYLIGSAPDTPLYIISKDTDFDLMLSFFARYLDQHGAGLSICRSIAEALLPDEETEPAEETEAVQTDAPAADEQTEETAAAESCGRRKGKAERAETVRVRPVQQKRSRRGDFPKELQGLVQELTGIHERDEVRRICAMVESAEDLLALNNLLSHYYHDGKRVKPLYHALKPHYKEMRRLLRQAD